VGALTLTRNAQNGLVTATALGSVTDTKTYDAFAAPSTYSASHAGNVVYAATYTRDARGRITSKSETIGGVTHVLAYTYDPAGRLTEVHEDSQLTALYSYDGNGNRLSHADSGGTLAAIYDAQDRLEQLGTTTYDSNAGGERQSKTAGGQTTDYHYDTQGNLIGATLPDATQIDYLLDGGQRCIGKRRNGARVQGFLYQDSLKPIAELDAQNNVISRFVYATGIKVPAYMIKAGVTYRIITDHLGSPRLVIDAATGTVIQRLDFDEFGNVVLDTNPGFQPFGFAGGLYDSDTQLTRYGLRVYDPETARWMSKDPAGFVSGPNLYAYADNDPVNLIDPLGTQEDTIVQDVADILGRQEIRGAEYRFRPGGFEKFPSNVKSGLIDDAPTTPPAPAASRLSRWRLPTCDATVGFAAAALFWIPRMVDPDYSAGQFSADLAIGPGVPILGIGGSLAIWIGFTSDPVGQVKEAAIDTGIGLGITGFLGPVGIPVNFIRSLFD
jgi:RHS repeat-associated protein